MKNNVYTIKDVCERYKITRQTFRSWEKQGLKTIKINRMVRIKAEDLKEFIDSNEKR